MSIKLNSNHSVCNFFGDDQLIIFTKEGVLSKYKFTKDFENKCFDSKSILNK
jgi:hypothetical protein